MVKKKDYPFSGLLERLTACQLERFTFHFIHLKGNEW